MNGNLIIHLSGHDDGPASWIPTDESGRPVGSPQHGPLVNAAGMAAGRRVIVLVPSERVLLTKVELPAVRGARLRQAVPYALEESVTTDVESLHCAVGAQDEDGAVTVAAVERSRMDAWSAALAGAGIRADRMLPDCLAVPYEDGRVGAALDEDGARIIVRDGPESGFACPADALEALCAAKGIDVPQGRIAPAGLLAGLAPAASAGSLDLMQGDFAPSRYARIDLGHWRVPAMLAAALAVVAVAGWFAEYRSLTGEHERLQREIATRFSELVPNEPLQDPRAQIERRLGRQAAGSDLLPLLDAVSVALVAVPEASLTSLSYRPGALEMGVTTRRADELERLRERIESDGRAQASIDGATSRGDRVEGRLSVRGRAR